MKLPVSKILLTKIFYLLLLILVFLIGTLTFLLSENDAKIDAKNSIKTAFVMYNSDLNNLEIKCLRLANQNIPLKIVLNNFKEENNLKILRVIDQNEINEAEFKSLKKDLQKAFMGISFTSTELYRGALSQIVLTPLYRNNNYSVMIAIRDLNEDKSILKSISKETNSNITLISYDELLADETNNNIIALLKRNPVYTGKVNIGNKNLIGSAMLIKSATKKNIAVLLLGVSPAKYKNILIHNFKISLTVILLFQGIVIILIYIFHIDTFEYLSKIHKHIRYAKEGDIKQKINTDQKSGYYWLAESINEMFEALQTRETEVKTYQEELKARKENLEAIFNSSTDGIITLNRELKIINVNPTITKWAGIKSEKIVGQHFHEIINCNCPIKMSDIDCNNPSTCPLAAYWKEDMPREASITNKKTNEITYIALSCSPIHGLATTKESFVIVLMDITHFKELEKLKENFVATLTHDLRVPLLAENHTLKYLIKGSYGELSEHQKVAAENMLKSNQDLLKLVNTLLDVYKYESGTLQLYKEPVNIYNLVSECSSDLYPLSKKNSNTVINNVNRDIPDIFVDRNELKRVFTNLIGNAIIYTQENGLIIIEAEQNTSNIIIKVIDNGKGIPENELKAIFDRYFSSSKKFRKVGTGLGLYLSKQIINAHDGKIWVESTIGKGSTFYFSLPLNTEVKRHEQNANR